MQNFCVFAWLFKRVQQLFRFFLGEMKKKEFYQDFNIQSKVVYIKKGTFIET